MTEMTLRTRNRIFTQSWEAAAPPSDILLEPCARAANAFFGVNEYDARIFQSTPNIGECAVVRLSSASFEINDSGRRDLRSTREPLPRPSKHCAGAFALRGG